MNILTNRLQLVEYLPYGGTILYPLLQDIAANFVNEADGLRYLEQLIRKEQELIQAGQLSSDFVIAVFRKE